ncbi:MAG: protease-like activity factor CPAF, partial [Pseudomonadota bacterium]
MARDVTRGLSADNPHKIGARQSFVPSLGLKIWESTSGKFYHSYMYMTEDRKLIGYIRIPSHAGELEAAEFEEIIGRFQKTTDALIIDEINNPGGSVFHLYALVSMLTDTALSTPRHQMTITPKDVTEAYANLDELSKASTDEEAQQLLGMKTSGGYPVDMKMVSFLKDNYRFILEEWNAGHTLTKPYFIWGVDKINPHPRVNYTKPILVLTNELDFSGGDFFPAILQDNKRVKILGTRTDGAGGY